MNLGFSGRGCFCRSRKYFANTFEESCSADSAWPVKNPGPTWLHQHDYYLTNFSGFVSNSGSTAIICRIFRDLSPTRVLVALALEQRNVTLKLDLLWVRSRSRLHLGSCKFAVQIQGHSMLAILHLYCFMCSN